MDLLEDWMYEVLECFDTLVLNAGNTFRLQEECDLDIFDLTSNHDRACTIVTVHIGIASRTWDMITIDYIHICDVKKREECLTHVVFAQLTGYN